MKKFLRKIHLYLGLFTLPVGIMLAATGVAYILGFDEDTGAVKTEYSIQEKIPAGGELEFIKKWAAENSVPMPKDETVTSGKKGLIIGGVNYSINIADAENGSKITVTERSFFGNMILLHKAKARWYFDVLSVLFGLSMLMFYISGLVMAAFTKNVKGRKIIKKEFVTALAAGVVVTVILAQISL